MSEDHLADPQPSRSQKFNLSAHSLSAKEISLLFLLPFDTQVFQT
jgi:hypothetical protein